MTKTEIAAIQGKIISGGSAISVVKDVLAEEGFEGRGRGQGDGMGAIREDPRGWRSFGPRGPNEPEDVQPRSIRRRRA